MHKTEGLRKQQSGKKKKMRWEGLSSERIRLVGKGWWLEVVAEVRAVRRSVTGEKCGEKDQNWQKKETEKTAE